MSHIYCFPQAQTANTLFCAFFQDKLLLPTTALLLSITLLLSVCTHQPAPQESHSCYGRWPASRAESRCSSTTLECPHSGRSYSWPGPHTHSHLQNDRVYSHLEIFFYSSYMDALRTHLLTCYCCHLTPLLVNVWSPGTVTVAVEGAFGVDALTVSTHRLIVAFVHICR